MYPLDDIYSNEDYHYQILKTSFWGAVKDIFYSKILAGIKSSISNDQNENIIWSNQEYDMIKLNISYSEFDTPKYL